MANNLVACVDFDGTIVTHKFPLIGNPVPLAIEKMLEMNKVGIKVILWTLRSGDNLTEAVEYVRSFGVELWGINKNPTQKHWSSSPKAYGGVYIDDAALGCPLIFDEDSGRPYVDWSQIEITEDGRIVFNSKFHQEAVNDG